jgi:hypothetical protein
MTASSGDDGISESFSNGGIWAALIWRTPFTIVWVLLIPFLVYWSLVLSLEWYSTGTPGLFEEGNSNVFPACGKYEKIPRTAQCIPSIPFPPKPSPTTPMVSIPTYITVSIPVHLVGIHLCTTGLRAILEIVICMNPEKYTKGQWLAKAL